MGPDPERGGRNNADLLTSGPAATITVDMRNGNGPMSTVIGLALVASGLSLGCSGGEATATERLWVTTVPTRPKAPITAFLTMRTSDERYLGAFFQGSLYRGNHDLFYWEDLGKDRARVQFLQDERRVELKLEECKPDRGFDYCLMVYGDPTGTTRYQSRKRWVIRRPGRKRDATAGLVPMVMQELAQDDEQLAAALDTAAEGLPE